MTQVASVRSVLGPARVLAPWWDADQVGKPITTIQAFWLRRLPGWRHRMPNVVARGLARRGLLEHGPATGMDLTEAGRALQVLLGGLPVELLEKRWRAQPAVIRVRFPHADSLTFGPLDTPTACPTCRRTVPAELIAWGATGKPCVRCATKETS